MTSNIATVISFVCFLTSEIVDYVTLACLPDNNPTNYYLKNESLPFSSK